MKSTAARDLHRFLALSSLDANTLEKLLAAVMQCSFDVDALKDALRAEYGLMSYDIDHMEESDYEVTVWKRCLFQVERTRHAFAEAFRVLIANTEKLPADRIQTPSISTPFLK